MNRKAFLLGFYATGGQVLLLRELVSSLNGDELFIGTALFGWLVWVAIGAYLGGRAVSGPGSNALFSAAILVLPITVVLTRLSPMVTTGLIGQIIPFSTAAVVSGMMMLPTGFIAGWLFPSITREDRKAAQSIVRVYLFEGIGAFAAGLIIAVLVGRVVATLGMSVILVAIVGGGLALPRRSQRRRGIIAGAGVIAAVLLITPYAASHADAYLEGVKNASYHVEHSFDTHYSHQAILSRDGSLVLLTDNTVEAVYPNLESAENMLIPPLAYNPGARRVLFVGRSEFGVAQLADSVRGLSLTTVDPRHLLTEALSDLLPVSPAVRQIENDPVALFSRASGSPKYDIMIVNPGELDIYRNSRLVTPRFLRAARSFLQPDGILYLPTRFDTDRYISADAKVLLSVIHNVLRSSFEYVTMWPGTMTLFFASDAPLADLTYDSVSTRLSGLGYSPQYISDNYLVDRLDETKVQRLREAVQQSDAINSMERPVLPQYQAWYRAKANSLDRGLFSLILRKPAWVVALPAAIVLLLVVTMTGRGRRRRFGLFLYFTAGVVSLSLELVSFYVFQSSAGSLYAEMAALIGVFMLGLALGTYFTVRTVGRGAEYCALLMFLAAAIVFLLTYGSVHPQMVFPYHLLFLFVSALATGCLFVAATRRFYDGSAAENRGSGYAFELLGSAVGALCAVTILLPVIGLQWLLLSLIALLVAALIGSLATS
ncbi:MAG TPA: hypothetical protein VMY05_09970 [Acidobacteriota bacterium]|nr:hypothetical protein [Acidobacteriota bacterium]